MRHYYPANPRPEVKRHAFPGFPAIGALPSIVVQQLDSKSKLLSGMTLGTPFIGTESKGPSGIVALSPRRKAA